MTDSQASAPLEMLRRCDALRLDALNAANDMVAASGGDPLLPEVQEHRNRVAESTGEMMETLLSLKPLMDTMYERLGIAHSDYDRREAERIRQAKDLLPADPDSYSDDHTHNDKTVGVAVVVGVDEGDGRLPPYVAYKWCPSPPCNLLVLQSLYLAHHQTEGAWSRDGGALGEEGILRAYLPFDCSAHRTRLLVEAARRSIGTTVDLYTEMVPLPNSVGQHFLRRSWAGLGSVEPAESAADIASEAA